jgi:hypothetical protein
MAVKWITDPDTLIEHPEIYPFSLDAARKRVIFVHVAREQFARAPFHDRSLSPSSGQKWAGAAEGGWVSVGRTLVVGTAVHRNRAPSNSRASIRGAAS